MVKTLDTLYKDEKIWLDYNQIDSIVIKYQEDISHRHKYIQELLQAFHKYFMKYVSLLKGTIGTIENKDTFCFLALFLSNSNRRGGMIADIYKYVVQVCYKLEPNDIYNELVVMFLELLSKFKFYPGVSFAQYITKYMRWAIKAWVMEMAQEPTNRNFYNTDEVTMPSYIYSDTNIPELSLETVFDDSNRFFSILTPYERFLIYLHFKEGLGMKQISERLGKAKVTINVHVQNALRKLRQFHLKGDINNVQ